MPRILPFGRNSRWYEALLLCGLYHYCFTCRALLVDVMEFYWSAQQAIVVHAPSCRDLLGMILNNGNASTEHLSIE